MLAIWRCPFRILPAIAVLTLVAFLASAAGTAAIEAEKTPQTGKRSQAGKKAAPKGKSPAGVKQPAAKPPDCTGAFPKIHKVQPDEGKAGSKVTVTGKNFGVPGCLSMVSFGPGTSAKFVHKDDSTVTVTVPSAKKGLRLLTVNTAAGQDSKPFLIR
jgi:hypothetical protein